MISVLFTPVLVLFLPIFDTVLVSITRRLNGRAVSAGAKDHSSHRLVMLGLSERGAVLTLYAISAMSSAVALLWIRLWPDFGTGVLVLFLVGGTLFWLYLAKVQLPEDWLSRTNVFTVVIPEFLHSIATHAAATLIDIALVLAAMYLAFLLRFEGIPRSLLASVFLSSTLAVGIKIPTMAVFGMYRRAWQVKSIPELYPLFKAGIIGSLALVSALVYMQRFENSSRGVLIIDFVLTFLFCSLARVSDKLFDGGLSKRPRSGCLLVGKNCASIVRTYFGWKGIHECPVAVTGSGPLQQGSTPGVPFIHIHEVPELFTRSLITSVCLLPD